MSTPEEQRKIVEDETRAFMTALRMRVYGDAVEPNEAAPAEAEDCAACDGDGTVEVDVQQDDLFAYNTGACVDHSNGYREDCPKCRAAVTCKECGGTGSARPAEQPKSHPADEWTLAALEKIPPASAGGGLVVQAPRRRVRVSDVVLYSRS